MKRWLIVLLVLPTGLLIACSQDAKVNTFVSKLDNLTNQMLQRIDQAPNPKAGVAAAQAYLDNNKAEFEKSYHEIEGLRGYQVNKKTTKHLTDSVTQDTTKVMGLKLKYAVQSVTDPALSKDIDKLTDDYTAMLGGQ